MTNVEGFNSAISMAVDNLCQRLLRYKNSTNRLLPLQLEQVVKLLPSASRSNATSINSDLIQWLRLQSQFPKFYWRSRDQSFETACLGIAQQFSNQHATQQLRDGIHYRNNLRYYWLSGFDPQYQNNGDTPQSDQPQQVLFLPQIELRYQSSQRQQQLILSVSLNDDTDMHSSSAELINRLIDDLIKQLKQLHPIAPNSSVPTIAKPITVSGRHDSPCFEQWQHSIQQAKRSFTEGCLQKVVLARQSRFQYLEAATKSDTKDASIPFWNTFERWRDGSINSYQIAYQLSAERGFISFTPERLFARQGLNLKTEALAATLARSSDNGRARQQAHELLSDSKSRHEHGLVAVEIGAKLEGLGVQLNHGCGTSLLKQNGLQHLHQTIQGVLPNAQMDAQLLSTLHPTAAVGGLPTEPARQFIQQHEPFSRGYYAGCCGYFEAGQSELAVTIRSADFNYPQLTLYAGAGIVPQSDPKLEWQELNQKIALPLSLFNLQIDQTHDLQQKSS